MKPRLSHDQLIRRRVRSLFYLLACLYCLLALRLFHIQVILAPEFKKKASAHSVKIPLLARRGTIYDRDGKKLALSIDAYDIFADPSMVTNKKEVAARLAPFIGWREESVLQVLNRPGRFAYLVRRADVSLWRKIEAENLPGIGATPTMKRVYPGGTLAAHILGFTNVDGVGIEGLEKAFDRQLRGKDGYVIAEVDARGEIIAGSRHKRVEPVQGKDLVLTIDSMIQHSLEMELEKSYSTHGAAGASAIVMDPKTGQILALANMPTFDPNHVAGTNADMRRNRAVTDIYEPGSTLKTITASAALNERVVDLDDTFLCTGSMVIGRQTVRCSLHAPFLEGHGKCNIAKILRYSCNMGAAGMGFRLGSEKLFSYEKAFGLYEKPGSEMPGEMLGMCDRWQDWPQVKLANVAFGQGIAVTPLQLAKAYCAVANGGLMMRPYVVKEVHRPDGAVEIVKGPVLIRRVISEQTSAVVSQALHGVVTGGTGKTAQVEGYQVAGKTGSSQKASTTARGFAEGKFIASFIGFLPLSDPRVVILVAVDEPKGTHWGATVAAPVFQQVAREAMWRMKVAPDGLPKPAAPVASEGKGTEHAEEAGSEDRPQLGG
ncbi:MAG TPA: penicillin-binding transpeptidase domain-containing protein [Armatimonadota bacterium]|nr:penicillin-binding transpeptidase domain-containing protein [Armatimonadota bacterium]